METSELLNLPLLVKSRLGLSLASSSLSGAQGFSQSVPNKHRITHEDIWLMKRVGALFRALTENGWRFLLRNLLTTRRSKCQICGLFLLMEVPSRDG
jgi:hypothetical protein